MQQLITELKKQYPHYLALMRVDRPIGTYLVLWPTLWALWLAAEGVPDWHLLLIFILGTFLMRSAGCVINDYADRKIDAHVSRTKLRPFAQGLVSEKEALILFASLCLLAFVLVLFTNPGLCTGVIHQSTDRVLVFWRGAISRHLPLYEALYPFTPVGFGRCFCVGYSDGLCCADRFAATCAVVNLHWGADLDGVLRHLLRDGRSRR